MTVIYIRDFVKARSALARPQSTAGTGPVTERTAPNASGQGGAWYHQAAIIEADKTVPRRD